MYIKFKIVKLNFRGEIMDNNGFIKNTLDQIPEPNPNASHVVGLYKEKGKVEGYKLSNGNIVSKPDAVEMAKQGLISGVGIAHRGDNQYLKSIPDGNENNNLSNLPSFTSK